MERCYAPVGSTPICSPNSPGSTIRYISTAHLVADAAYDTMRYDSRESERARERKRAKERERERERERESDSQKRCVCL
eukprot:3940894-Rhodomonas_salina.1